MDNPPERCDTGDVTPVAWTQLDEYLWHTCDILADLVEGRLEERPPVATMARLDPDERALAVGPAELWVWRAVGDGSYVHNNVVAFGSPGMVLSTMIGSAIGNAARARAAAEAARPRWVPDSAGEVTLTTRKIFFGNFRSPLVIGWDGMDAIDLVAPDIFQCTLWSNGQHWPVRFRTPWASLVFVLTAMTSFPAHPRLLGAGWLPPDFEQRCAAVGRPCRPAARLVLERTQRN